MYHIITLSLFMTLFGCGSDQSEKRTSEQKHDVNDQSDAEANPSSNEDDSEPSHLEPDGDETDASQKNQADEESSARIHESGDGFKQGFVGEIRKSNFDLSDASLLDLRNLCTDGSDPLPAGTVYKDDDDGLIVCAGSLDWLRYKTMNYGLGEDLVVLYGGVFSYKRDGKRRLAVIGLDVTNSSSPQLSGYCDSTEYSVNDDQDFEGIGGGPLDRRDELVSSRSLCAGGDIHLETVDSLKTVIVTLPSGETHKVNLKRFVGEELELPPIRE